MSRNGQEILREGWLTKSPPTKRIWRGRWRRRWFTLHAGDLPGQYILSYYTDRNSRKLKGFVNLDLCEQVDTGLKFEDKKYKFDFMFDIKTPARTYYLAADTEVDMKAWVKCICNICGLKATSDEEDTKFEEQQMVNSAELESPPISPVSTSPYIPISECITGKTPVLPNQSIKDFNTLLQYNVKSSYFRRNVANDTYENHMPTYLNCDSQFYDMPRSLGQLPQKMNNLNKTHSKSDYCNFDKNINQSPLQSPTDSESVFTDDDWSHNTSLGDSKGKIPRPSNSSIDADVQKTKPVQVSPVAPPRPPKPTHIIMSRGACYLNLQNKDEKSKSSNNNSATDDLNVHSGVTDDMYDFPRSHNTEPPSDMRDTLKRHCYNNAAPSVIDGQVFTYDIPSPKPSTSQSAIVFRYGDEISDEPASPLSQSSSTAQYSNLPSPLLPTTQLMLPPKVNRGLKPKRKLSDSTSISSNPEPASPYFAPSINRKLKPPKGTSATMPRKLGSNDENVSIRFRAAPSPVLSSHRSFESLMDCDSEAIYRHVSNDQRKILEYLDLDLDGKNNNPKSRRESSVEPPRSPGAGTVYKKVDFMKTEAFNITKNNLEKERNKSVLTLKK